MPIYRIHSARYTVVDNEILESTELSWKAKGLLGYMLGRPDKWEFSERALYTMFPDGQTATRSGIKELEAAGYLHRERVRENGKVTGCVWHVFQRPTAWPQDDDKNHDLVFQTWQTPTGKTTNNKILNRESTEEESTDNVEKPKFADEIREIVAYLNERTGKRFSDRAAATAKLVRARLNDGYSVDDFKRVIDNKVAQWASDPKFRNYLQPSTLFAQSHFDEYLNQAGRPAGRIDFSAYDR